MILGSAAAAVAAVAAAAAAVAAAEGPRGLDAGLDLAAARGQG